HVKDLNQYATMTTGKQIREELNLYSARYRSRFCNGPDRVIRLFLALGLLLLTTDLCFSQSAPEVSKVEPPGWWAGHSVNPVRVLVHGRNLTNARVETTGDGVRANSVKVNAAGTYLFVDVEINRLAQPGNRRLRIATPNGSASANFEILSPL